MLSTGAVVTSGGLPVLDVAGQPVMLNPLGERPVISENGTIFQGPALVGQLGVVDVADKNALIKEGANLFVGRDSELPPTFVPEEISVNQGYTEMPNVQVVSEMVNMINTHRSYEAYQKTLHVMQEMDNKTVSQVGRVGS
jgi:flagellar basal-body rod protein FlgG